MPAEIVLEKIESEPVMEEEAVPALIPDEAAPEATVQAVDEPILEQEHAPEPPISSFGTESQERQQTEAPQPKRRGRPPKAKAEALPKPPKPAPGPKATRAKKPPPPPDSDSSSDDVDETLRNVYNHVAKPDMETAILQFLVNRKQSEQARRRELWGRLAQM